MGKEEKEKLYKLRMHGTTNHMESNKSIGNGDWCDETVNMETET